MKLLFLTRKLIHKMRTYFQGCDLVLNGECYVENHSIGGQNGIDFLKNLLMNLINVLFSSKNNLFFKLTFDKDCNYDLATFFNRMLVPFLYSLDREDKFFDQLNNVSNFVCLKKFERTSDSEQIDGKFEFKLDEKEQLAVIECKNRVAKISSSIIYDILIKSEPKNPKLILVFCNEIVKELDENSKLIKFCDLKRINVYTLKRLRRDGNFLINIKPFYEIFEDPNIICIIFESTIINNL